MRIYLEPQDVLFLRDGTPFGAVGSQHMVTSIFPPNPSTFYGALRAAIIKHNGVSFSAFSDGLLADESLRTIVGDTSSFGSLMVNCIILAKRMSKEGDISWVLPAPADLVEDKDKKDPKKYSLLRPVPGVNDAVTNFPNQQLNWLAPAGHWEAMTSIRSVIGYISGQDLEHYLCGEPPCHIMDQKEVMVREWRIGIGRGKSKTTTEGRLFQVEYIRLQEGIGFLIELVGVNGKLPQQGWLRLGGDSRTVFYRQTTGEMKYPLQAVTDKIKSQKQFRVVLLTPAIFKAGWLPDFFDTETLVGELDHLRVRLLSAAIPYHQAVSGWDIQKRFHKPLCWAVPAGSVYFCEILDENPDVKSWLAYPIKRLMQRDREGFGLGIIGG